MFANGEHIMRAADCKNLAESPEGDFRHAEAGCNGTPLFALLLVFSFGSHAAPDVSFLLVPVQNFPDLCKEGRIIRGEFLANILMDSRF